MEVTEIRDEVVAKIKQARELVSEAMALAKEIPEGISINIAVIMGIDSESDVDLPSSIAVFGSSMRLATIMARVTHNSKELVPLIKLVAREMDERSGPPEGLLDFIKSRLEERFAGLKAEEENPSEESSDTGCEPDPNLNNDLEGGPDNG